MSLVRNHHTLPDYFNRFFNTELENWDKRNYSSTSTTLPAVNIIETKEDYRVEVAAPGFEKSDFKIELDHEILTISSDKKNIEEVKEGELITKQEFSYQSFERTFRLPEQVEESKITAKYNNGILLITLPKKDEVIPKPPKQIKIK